MIMCEKTLFEQFQEAAYDAERLQHLIDQHIYLKFKNTDQPTKIYPLDGCEHSVDELRKAIDKWLSQSKQ